jgi:capsular polysaccharide biosynthesis protein/Mrp family chromosome partitioning ATPase
MDMRAEISPKSRFALLEDQTQRRQGQSTAEATPQFDLNRAWQHIRRRLAIIVISVAVGGSLSVLASIAIKPTFTATALIAVNEADDGANRNNDVSVDTQLAMLQSPIFMDRAFEALSRDDRLRAAVPQRVDLERRLKVIQQLRSRLIGVTFSAKSPSDAADIANKIARLYVEDPYLQSMRSVDDASETWSRQIAILEAALQHVESRRADGDGPFSGSAAAGVKASDLRDQIAALKLDQSLARRRADNREQMQAMSPPVQLVALAQPPTRPSSVRPLLIIVPATILSTIFGVALARLRGRLDKRIYLPSDLAEKIAFPCAGAIPARRYPMIAAANRASGDVGYLRAIDSIVTEVLLMQRAPKRTVLVTRSEEDTEASEFALSLASAAARMRRRVLLVDVDTTRPAKRLLSRRGSNQGPDVFDVLAGRCPVGVAIQSVSGTDLDCLPNRHDCEGDALPLIAGGRLKQLVADLQVDYDWIILQGSPVIGVSETRLIAAVVDATILLVRSGISRLPEVGDALDTLSLSMTSGAFGEVSSQIFTVLTDAPRRSLPAPFRDKRAAERPDAPPRPLESATDPVSRETPETSSDLSDPGGSVNRLVPSRESSR